jgi:dTDP-L-rhamnose 4-epimerase
LKALITGGAGMIGSHIADLLLKMNWQVRVLDNLNKPTHQNGKPDWLHEQIEFIEGDVRDRDVLDKALRSVDWVFHQAADGGFTSAISHYFTNNSLPTAILYELIRDKHPVSKVVVASSQAVYGEGKYLCANHGPQYPPPRTVQQLTAKDWEVHCHLCGEAMTGIPIDESHTNPLLPYAMSKYWSERLALQLGKLYDIPTSALRYSLTFGPRQSLFNPYTGICSIFSTRILNGKGPVIYEDGLQTRDFIFVEDVARANILVAEKEETNYEVYNVGTGIATTIFEFASILERVYGKQAKPEVRGEFRPGDFRHLSTDATKLKALGWSAQVPLEDGLRRYAKWIQTYGSVEEYFSQAEFQLKQTQIIMQSL